MICELPFIDCYIDDLQITNIVRMNNEFVVEGVGNWGCFYDTNQEWFYDLMELDLQIGMGYDQGEEVLCDYLETVLWRWKTNRTSVRMMALPNCNILDDREGAWLPLPRQIKNSFQSD